MKTFREWLDEKQLEWNPINSPAVRSAVAGAGLAFGVAGCQGGKCDKENQPKPHNISKQYITIDDGRQIEIPSPRDMDTIEYLNHLNKTREEMGQPPLPVKKTIDYLSSLQG